MYTLPQAKRGPNMMESKRGRGVLVIPAIWREREREGEGGRKITIIIIRST